MTRSTRMGTSWSSLAAAVLGLATSAVHAEMIKIDTVIIVGSRCPSGATCGTYSLDGTMQEANNSWLYAPFSVTSLDSEAAAVRKFMDFLAKSKDDCRRAGESQAQWLDRQIKNRLASNIFSASILPHITKVFLEDAQAERMNPPPPSCK